MPTYMYLGLLSRLLKLIDVPGLLEVELKDVEDTSVKVHD